MRIGAGLLGICSIISPALAESVPRYHWSETDLTCAETGDVLSDNDFLRRVVESELNRARIAIKDLPEDLGTVLAAHEGCCIVERWNHRWNLPTEQMEGLSGLINRWFSGPVIMVEVSFTRKIGDDFVTFLLSPCGVVTERFGPELEWIV